MEFSLKNRVALITGGGGALGRSHAMTLLRRGARIVVNDFEKKSVEETVRILRDMGGEAIANHDSVENLSGAQRMVEEALKHFGRLDIVINNAGNLRDVSFRKQSDDDWNLVIKTHLDGSRHVTKAAWDIFCQQSYGRIVMTTSASGLYGNFGQSNYAAAKMGIVGLMNSLKEEGEKFQIKINAIAPLARSRMTEPLMPPEMLEKLDPQWVSPVVAYLVSEECSVSGHVWAVGAGKVARVAVVENEGVDFSHQSMTPETIHGSLSRITDLSSFEAPKNMMEAVGKMVISKN